MPKTTNVLLSLTILSAISLVRVTLQINSQRKQLNRQKPHNILTLRYREGDIPFFTLLVGSMYGYMKLHQHALAHHDGSIYLALGSVWNTCKSVM